MSHPDIALPATSVSTRCMPPAPAMPCVLFAIVHASSVPAMLASIVRPSPSMPVTVRFVASSEPCPVHAVDVEAGGEAGVVRRDRRVRQRDRRALQVRGTAVARLAAHHRDVVVGDLGVRDLRPCPDRRRRRRTGRRRTRWPWLVVDLHAAQLEVEVDAVVVDAAAVAAVARVAAVAGRGVAVDDGVDDRHRRRLQRADRAAVAALVAVGWSNCEPTISAGVA